MQIRCSFRSVILAGRYDRKKALTRRHKNTQKKHTRPHSRTQLGRMVPKEYSSPNLAAHNCTTSGFRAAFLFRDLLGSTTYNPREEGTSDLSISRHFFSTLWGRTGSVWKMSSDSTVRL